MELLGRLFSLLFNSCLSLVGNDYLAVIVFTLLSKIIIMPITIIVHLNSIKMVKMYPSLNRIKANYYGDKDTISEKQYELYQESKYHPLLDIIPTILQLVILLGVAKGFPQNDTKSTILLSILAALSSFIMCAAQNKSNVLQSEQSNFNKVSVLLFSVGLSLFLGLTSTRLIVFYWIISNILSTIIMYILNFIINPKKYINYDELEKSKKELEDVKKYNASNKKIRSKELIERENKDYKRFLKYQSKQIVFYSEKNGFYKYYKDTIELILKKTDIIIHYISSDPNDEIFKFTSDNFQTYYIDEKLMVLMMKMDADVVVMTTPDLQNYYLKRSIVRDDIEYVYMDHGFSSMNLTYHHNALAFYDTIFVQNESIYNELIKQEEKYEFKNKKIIKSGYALIDNMIKSYVPDKKNNKTILIAPSWQKDNIMDLCINDLLDELLDTDYQIIVRPHPQYVRHCKDKLDELKDKYKNNSNFILQDDFSSNSDVYNADILLTDWSGIAYEYSFTTLKPVIFINTPMKVINEKYKEIDIIPFDIELREKIGKSIDVENIKNIKNVLTEIEENKNYSSESISKIRDSYLFNICKSAKINAKYLVDTLIEKYNNSVSKNVQRKEIKTDNVKYSFKTKLINAFIICSFFFLTFYYFSSLEVFFTSNADFPFPINNVWWIMLLFSLIVILFMSIIISLFNTKIYRFLIYMVFIGGICFYIQELLLNGNVTSLVSDVITFEKSVCNKNLVIWLLMIILSLVLFIILRKINLTIVIKYLSLFLIVIQTIGLLSVSSNVLDRKYVYLSDNLEYELSSINNTIVFILDMCDGDYVNSTLIQYSDLFSNLDGFTYYPDCISKYTRTYPSVPYLLTHVDCRFDRPWEEYIDYAWENGNIVNKIKSNGNSIGLYTTPEFIPERAEQFVDNYSQFDVNSLDIIDKEALLKEMAIIAMFKCTPYYFKEFIINKYPPALDRVLVLENNCIQYDDTRFYEELIDRKLSINANDNNGFRFYHLKSTHSHYNEKVENVKGATTEETLYSSFVIINEYIKQMKELGVYDNSTIIITADHGDPFKQYNEQLSSPMTILCLTKLPNQHGELKTSNTPVCHDDIIEIYAGNDIHILENKEINSLEKRSLYLSCVAGSSSKEDYLKQYDIVGDSRDFSNWSYSENSWKIEYSIYATNKGAFDK